MILLIGVAAILGLLALTWYFQWYEINWYWGPIVMAAIVGWCFAYILINKLLINRMKRATSPKQLLRLAKCLKWWIKLNRALVALIIFIPLLEPLIVGHQYSTALLVVGPLLILCYLAAHVDSDYSDGLKELEYRLDD